MCTLSKEFEKRTLGIKHGTYKSTFIAWAVNRREKSVCGHVQFQLKHIKWTTFTGFVRVPDAIDRLKDHRRKLGACNMPSIDQLLAHFMPGGNVKRTFLLKPDTFLPKTEEHIPIDHIPPKGIKAMAGGRVSTDKQERDGEGMQDQCMIFKDHAFKHHPDVIPHSGMLCFLETCSGWNKVPASLLILLYDPILSKCDDDGDCIACSIYYVTCAERVMKNEIAFIEIRDALNARNINIWSIRENIGSRSHPDLFLEKIRAAETLAKNQSDRARDSSKRRGTRHCSVVSPKKSGDPWSTKEDNRLRCFFDRASIPDEYICISKQTGKESINWMKLAKEFPCRSNHQIRKRFQSLKKKGNDRVTNNK
jgi:hypothetical protein